MLYHSQPWPFKSNRKTYRIILSTWTSERGLVGAGAQVLSLRPHALARSSSPCLPPLIKNRRLKSLAGRSPSSVRSQPTPVHPSTPQPLTIFRAGCRAFHSQELAGCPRSWNVHDFSRHSSQVRSCTIPKELSASKRAQRADPPAVLNPRSQISQITNMLTQEYGTGASEQSSIYSRPFRAVAKT